MFSVSLLFPPPPLLGSGSGLFFSCWAYPGKIWGKIKRKIKPIFMLCICYHYSWRVIIPAILTIGNNVINFRPTYHSRRYSARGSTFITIEETEQSKGKKRKEKKRKEEFLDASSRGLSVEITMLRVNISFQFGLKSGGQILD